MWFKNATVLGIARQAKFDFSALAANQFTPIGSHQALSIGWSPVREELAYTQGLHHLLHFTIEKKVIPASAVATRLAAKVAEVTKANGFAPGKKASKDLKERVIDEMLPTAFASRSVTKVWIDRVNRRIVIDSTSKAAVDMIQSALIKAFGDIGLQDVSWPESTLLTVWLTSGAAGYTVDDEAALQWPGEKGKTAKFARANLQDKDVMQGIASGAQVVALAMTFDSRLSFIMTDAQQIRRIRPLDIVTAGEASDKEVDRFDNDFYLMTAELSRLFNELGDRA